MKCQAVQNQILALPDPRELPPALRAHVLTCAACQAWARQAARLEGLLEQLFVPPAPAEKKEALLGELMAADPVIHPMATLATKPHPGRVAARLLYRNANYVAGIAAAALVVVGIFAIWPKGQPPTAAAPIHKHPLLEKMVGREVAMARADTPVKTLDALKGMAADIANETRGMARLASGAELKQMTGWYEEVVVGGLVPRAQNLPNRILPADKDRLLDALASELDAEVIETEKVERESPPDAQNALKQLANVARNGEKLRNRRRTRRVRSSRWRRTSATKKRSPRARKTGGGEVVRWAFALIAFIGLATWAGAQGPASPASLSAEDKLRLLRANSALIENLVRDGIKISKTDQPVERATHCRAASRSLVNAIQEAARAEDAERVAELTDLYRTVVRDGLLPTLAEAKRDAAPGSPAEVTLREVRTNSTNDVSQLKTALTSVGSNQRVQENFKHLDELTEALK